MKRVFTAATWLFALAAVLAAPTAAAPVIAKNVTGHILSGHLDLTLATSAPCDQTAAAIPDGSRLVSDSLILRADDKGVGVVSGPVRLVRPDGSLIAELRLHGTIGLGDSTAATDADCLAPGHVEAWLERPATTAASDGAMPQVHLIADVGPEAGIVPVYKGTLLGLIEPPPPALVTVTTDRAQYAPADAIVGTVSNGLSVAIQAATTHSYCTILQLEQHVNDAWVPIGTCQEFRASPPVVIPAGASLHIVLPADAGRAPGEYRLTLAYRPAGDGGVTPDYVALAVSPPFRVVAATPALTITPNERAYGPHQPITAILRNGAAAARILDENSFCTIVQLQRLDGGQWVQIAPCPLERVAIPTFLKPGEVRRVTLPPANSVAVNWAPGRYRLAVTYTGTDDSGAPVGPEVLAVSPTFPVGAVVIPLDRTHSRAH
jgi:hypothetical protein